MKRWIRLLAAAAMGLLLILPQPALAASQSGEYLPDYAEAIVREVNLERAKVGLAPLTVDPELTYAARTRAREIVQRMGHTRPDGSSWRTVSARAFGENLSYGRTDPDRAMAGWMGSPGHRANILRASFGSTGVACYRAGNGRYYWVQLFGR